MSGNETPAGETELLTDATSCHADAAVESAPAMPSPSPTWYRIDPGSVTWTEMREVQSLPLCLLARPLIRLGAGCIVDSDPAVDSVSPFVVSAADVPADMLARMKPRMDELAALGFAHPVYHRITDPINFTTYTWASLRRPSGAAIARVGVFESCNSNRRFVLTFMISRLTTGTFVVSTLGEHTSTVPPDVQYQHHASLPVGELLAAHDAAVGSQPVFRVMTDEQVLDVTDDLHRAMVTHNVATGRYHLPRQVAPPPVEPYDHQLHAAAAKLLEPAQQRHWHANLKLLLITTLAFVALLGPATDWTFALALVPILLLHEAGHWLAMKAFGYGDVRMFFIPLFGAAVMGKQPRIAGWKPVVMYLAGPVPGILLAIPLAIYADRQQIDWLRFFAWMMLFINMLNMLPVMPLDGGRITHALLFQRHYLLDVCFRIFAGAFLLIVGGLVTYVMLGEGPVITGLNLLMPLLGVVMLLSLPSSWTVGRTVRAMRQHLRDDAFDPTGKPTPALAYEVGLAHRDGARKQKTAKKSLEHLVTRSRETIDALGTRPVGLLGTALLGGTYVGMIVLGVMAGVMVIAGGGYRDNMIFHPLDTSATVWAGSEAPLRPPGESVTLIATYESHDAAAQVFASLKPTLNSDQRMLLFGHAVLVEQPRYGVDRSELRSLLTQNANGYAQVAGLSAVKVTFLAELPAEASRHIEDQLNGYFRTDTTRYLIAPWDPGRTLTMQQLVARRTIARVSPTELMLNINSQDVQWLELESLITTTHDPDEKWQLLVKRLDRLRELQIEAFDRMYAVSNEELSRDVVIAYININPATN